LRTPANRLLRSPRGAATTHTLENYAAQAWARGHFRTGGKRDEVERELLAMDDRHLADIGISRSDNR